MKELILQVVNDLPDDFTIDDFLEELFLRMRIKKSIKDVEDNNTISQEEFKSLLSKWT